MYVGGTFDTRWDNDVMNPAFAALNAGDFEVVQLGWRGVPTVAVTRPNGGESWPISSIQTLSWTQSSLSASGQLKLSYTDGTTTTPIATLARTATSYTWTVPNVQGSGFRLVVCSDVGGACEVSDQSDGVFSIVAPAPPPPRSDFNGDGRPDLLWRHVGAGYLSVWLMNGVTMTGAVGLVPGQVADTTWQVVGSATSTPTASRTCCGGTRGRVTSRCGS